MRILSALNRFLVGCIFLGIGGFWGCQFETKIPEKAKKIIPEGYQKTLRAIRYNHPPQLNPEIYFKGNLAFSATWQDKNGYNLALLTRTGNFVSASAQEALEVGEALEVVNGMDAEIYAYHYIKRGKVWHKIYGDSWVEWQCPYHLLVDFARAPVVSDVDKDGFAELQLQIFQNCGRSQRKMQLLIENDQVFSLFSGEGQKSADGLFRKNQTFKKYSLNQWEKF